MVIAYELSVLNSLKKPGKELEKSTEGWGELKREAASLLEKAGIPKGSPLHHRIMERLAITGSVDIPLFLSVVKRIPL
jgi:hypothetical protein